MAIARGNLAGIKQYSDAIKSGQEQLDNAMNQVKASIDSALQDINKEKTKADKVKETCGKGIGKVSNKIDELKSKLNDLESELASTPPEIEIHYTDDDGSTSTVTKPNPKYLQLLSEIAQVQEELNKYKKLLSQLNDLVKKIDNQIDTLEQSQKRIGDLKEKLVGVKRNSYELLADALIKLNKIQDAISRYMSVKIEAPNLNFGHDRQNNKPQLNNNIDRDAEINDDEIIKESDLEEDLEQKSIKFSVNELYYQTTTKCKVISNRKFSKFSSKDAFSLDFSSKSALNDYSSEDYKGINNLLRNNKEVEDFFSYQKRSIENKIDILSRTIENHQLQKNTKLYRGMGSPDWILGDGWQNKSIEQLKEEVIGKVKYDYGFCSTTTNESVAKQFADCRNGTVMEIDAPKGARAIFMGGVSTYEEKEQEVLLQRSSGFIIEDLEYNPISGFKIKGKLICRGKL